jgi:hypothetical protein
MGMFLVRGVFLRQCFEAVGAGHQYVESNGIGPQSLCFFKRLRSGAGAGQALHRDTSAWASD